MVGSESVHAGTAAGPGSGRLPLRMLLAAGALGLAMAGAGAFVSCDADRYPTPEAQDISGLAYQTAVPPGFPTVPDGSVPADLPALSTDSSTLLPDLRSERVR